MTQTPREENKAQKGSSTEWPGHLRINLAHRPLNSVENIQPKKARFPFV